MATWPTDLKINRENFKEEPPSNALRSSMETGPAKVRKRAASAVRPVSFNMMLDDDDLETFDAFYLANEALSFDFTHPRTEATVSARFQTEEPVSYDLKETMWVVNVKLEILP